MKKIIAFILAVVMVFALVSCSDSGSNANNKGSSSANNNKGSSSSEVVAEGDDAVTNLLADGTLAATFGEGANGKEVAEYVDQVVYAMSGTSFDIGPFGKSSGGREFVAQRIYAGLMYMPYYGAPLEECQYNLAKSVTKTDDLTYEVELYDYIHDSKGNAITSEDVVFSYEMCRKVQNPSTIGAYLDEIIVHDDYNMTFKLKSSGAGVIESVLANYKMCIVDKDWYENSSDDEHIYDIATTNAYYISKYDPGSILEFLPVEDYWQTDPNLVCDINKQTVGHIIYKSVKEDAMRAITLENNECDAASIEKSDISHFFDAATGEAGDGYSVHLRSSTGYYKVQLNMSDNSVLKDNYNLRMAILCALNGEEIGAAIGLESYEFQTCTGFGTNIMAGWSDELDYGDEYYPKSKAQEYFEASGYKAGELTLVMMAKTSLIDAFVTMAQAQLQAIGINVEILSVDSSLANTYMYDSTKWDLWLNNDRAEGYVTDAWNTNFHPDNYSEGVYNASFCEDTGDLVSLIEAATQTLAVEDLVAVSDTLYEMAMYKPIFVKYEYFASQDGILEFAFDAGMNPVPNLFKYSVDYVSDVK